MGTTSRESQPICKVCERGALAKRKIYRMSGPVVVIGFILLIPSITGIAISALIFSGAISYGIHNVQDSDMQFRYNCIATDQANAGIYAPNGEGFGTPTRTLIPFCECELSAVKSGKTLSDAKQTCIHEMQDNALPALDQNTQELIDENLFAKGYLSQPESEQPSIFVRIIGSSFAVFLAIASFVGGLLGWLLIMKKRVLQCPVCGATVGAA
jgi:hypothetical protein